MPVHICTTMIFHRSLSCRMLRVSFILPLLPIVSCWSLLSDMSHAEFQVCLSQASPALDFLFGSPAAAYNKNNILFFPSLSQCSNLFTSSLAPCPVWWPRRRAEDCHFVDVPNFRDDYLDSCCLTFVVCWTRPLSRAWGSSGCTTVWTCFRTHVL